MSQTYETNHAEVRQLTQDEIDAVGGGSIEGLFEAAGKLWRTAQAFGRAVERVIELSVPTCQ
jgi:hypothetical protein